MLLACHMVSPAVDQDSGPAAAFARLKALAGRWEGQSQHGKATLEYELTGGDTALVERETSEHMQPMMTVYHLDGDRLVLTHYCMAGNQPRMAAKSYRPGYGRVRFRDLRGGQSEELHGWAHGERADPAGSFRCDGERVDVSRERHYGEDREVDVPAREVVIARIKGRKTDGSIHVAAVR